MGTQGFWSADLEATVARMNATLVQFATQASRPASSTATEGMLFVATDSPFAISYDNGSAWVEDIAPGVTQAVQSAIEAETNEDTYVPPDLIKHSPGVAKVWCHWEQSGAHGISASHNMTSVTDGGAAGDTDHLWNIDFSGADYPIVFGCNVNFIRVSAPAVAGGVTTLTEDPDNTGFDSTENFLAAFGDQ